MQPAKTHWPSIILFCIIALGALVLFTIAFAAGIVSIVGLFDEFSDSAGSMISSFASGFEMILLGGCAWFILQKAMSKAEADQVIRFPFSPWHIFVIPAIVLFSLSLGELIAVSEVKWLGWLTLPALTLLSVVLPILLFLGLGTNGIDLGPRWKAWGVLGIGLTVSPILIITVEIATVMVFAIAAGLFISTRPGLMQELLDLAPYLEKETSQEGLVRLFAPYITSPTAIASIFLLLSLVVPLIEEMFKPLAVWIFARKITSPATGFALGMLSGGAFALIESLNVSGNGSSAWFVIVAVRVGTGLLHMTTAGLMGFAIVQVFQEKRIGRFISTYLAAVILHGIWNACAVGATLTTIGDYAGEPQWIWSLPAALCGIAVLVAGLFAILIAANRKMRAISTASSAAGLRANEEGVK